MKTTNLLTVILFTLVLTAVAFATNEPESFDKERSALVLIEYQNEWLSPDGKINGLMKDRTQFENSIEKSKEILEFARENDLNIVHVGLRFSKGHPELGNAKFGLREAIPRVGTFREYGSAFPEPFNPHEGEFIVSGRIGASGFAGSNLNAYLRNQGIDTIYLMGYALHVCVESTLRDGHDRGYNVILLEETTSAFTPEQRKHVLEEVVHHYGASIINESFMELVNHSD